MKQHGVVMQEAEEWTRMDLGITNDRNKTRQEQAAFQEEAEL